MFEFGVLIQNFVQPFLHLFTREGFAPLLAFAIFLFAAAKVAWIYFRHVAKAKTSLKKAADILSSINSPSDFASRFNDIDALFSSINVLKHGWEEFKETLLAPEGDVGVFRNTVRPNLFINIHHVEGVLRLKRLHFISNLLVGIGLLLTFLGLVAALTQAGEAIGKGGGGNIEAPIVALLQVAAFKFWTSVSGLGCSILLRIFYEWQHNNIGNLITNINHGIERGLQFITPEYLAVEQLREAREQSAAMKRFSTDLAVSLANEMRPVFSTALAPVQETLKDIGQRITGGIGDAIKDTAGSEMQALSNSLSSIVTSLNNSRAEMDGMAGSIRTAIAEAAEMLRSSAGSASTEMAQQLKDVMTTLSEESRKQANVFDEAMRKLSGVVDQASETAGGEITKAAQNLASGINGVGDGVRDAAGAMAERMNMLASVLKTIEDRMQAHVQAMDALTNRASDTEKAMGTTSRYLVDAAAPVTQASERMASTADSLNQSIGGVRQIVTDVHQNLVLLSQKMAETQTALQNSWQSYDKRFGQVDQNLARALEGIVGHVNNSLESLSRYVGDMDKTLGDAVKQFAQNISELKETAGDFEEASTNLVSSVNKIVENKTAA